MRSFYGGPNGQSFEVKQVFTTKNGLTNSLVSDLAKGWTSPISVGEFVVISYGMPNDPGYYELRMVDLNKESKGYNSTLWQKCYDEEQGSANGLYYKLIASMTGNTPQILVDQPSEVLDVDEEPYVTYDGSNIDQPVLKFHLPQSQRLHVGTTQVLDANASPEVLYDNGDEDDPELGGTINEPVIQFNLPQSQVIEQALVEYLRVTEKPQVSLDITNINRPVLKFQLPVAQQLLEKNVGYEEIDADRAPYIEFDATTNPDEPTLKFYLPQSQVMDAPETVVVDPTVEPKVTDIGTVNAPKLQFELPRAIQFYYGSLLGERTATDGIYELANDAFADYAVGDYYINAVTGFIYRVIETQGTWCKFQYVASFQAPLPAVKVDDTSLTPYTPDLQPSVPQVTMSFENNDQKTGWVLTFKMPRVPVPEAAFEFIGAAEEGAVKAEVISETAIGFDFKIPAGSRMFAGMEVNDDHLDTVVAEAKPGDLYLNTDSGKVYILGLDNLWVSREGSLKGPVGDALNVVADYRLTAEDGYEDNLTNGVDYIKATYSDTYDPDKLFAITWVEETVNESGETERKETAYWYFCLDGQDDWGRVQLTSGILNYIQSVYNDEAEGSVDNKTYSISYINKLVGGEMTSDNMDKTTFSKEQVYEMLSWGTW